MSLFIARLGVVATASHQIVSNMAAVLYMLPLSLAIASSSRVSFWIGANDMKRARHALRTGLGLIVALGLTVVVLMYWQRDLIASLYTHSPEVAGLAATLLVWLTLYHAADAIQVFCVFALRSYSITFLPLLTYTVLLWGLGLAGGYVVAYGRVSESPLLSWLVADSPIAFWQTASVALTITSAVLLPMLWRAAYRLKP
jgi:MATE family multidrug resistance protein